MNTIINIQKIIIVGGGTIGVVIALILLYVWLMKELDSIDKTEDLKP